MTNKMERALPETITLENEEVATNDLSEESRNLLMEILNIEAQIEGLQAETRSLDMAREKLSEILGVMLADL